MDENQSGQEQRQQPQYVHAPHLSDTPRTGEQRHEKRSQEQRQRVEEQRQIQARAEEKGWQIAP